MIGRRRSRIPIPPPEHQNRARVNEKIRAPDVRLIDEKGEQVGVMRVEEARSRAVAAGHDLVEVAPEAKPPVCRIMDYGKYLFELQKKERQAKAHAHKTDTKEVRLRPGTGDGDLNIKVKHAREFLAGRSGPAARPSPLRPSAVVASTVSATPAVWLQAKTAGVAARSARNAHRSATRLSASSSPGA